MNIEIQVETAGSPVKRFELGEGKHLVGSLTGPECAVTLAFPTVSRRHGKIVVSDGTVSYFDLSSRNGSKIRNEEREARAIPGVAMAWKKDDTLEVGPFLLSWQPAGVRSSVSPRSELDLAAHAAHYARLLAERPQQARDVFFDGLAPDPARDAIVERVHREFHGDGPLGAWLRDPACREILVNAHDEIYVDRGDGLYRAGEGFLTRETFEAWATRTAHESGRRLDLQSPICEATLTGGARFHAVLPPVSARALSVSIRRFGSAPVTEADALATRWISSSTLAALKTAIQARENIVISGGTSTGKTSLLNFLCGYLRPEERVITVEDTVELAPPLPNLVQLQARGANADGMGQVTLRQLVQCALRMRPDRIIVGECRGAEVLEMLQALNTGHPGSLTTVHANSTSEALRRLELLALLGASNLSVECVREWIRSTVDLVVQVERDPSGTRRVAGLFRREKDGSGYRSVDVDDNRQVAPPTG